MSRLILFFAMGIGLAACVDRPIPAADRPRLYAHQPHHGLGGIPWARRLEVRRNRALLTQYRQWLANPERAPQGVHVATMLWWLGESGELTHVPTFIRFTTDAARDPELFTVVVYGLTRTARSSTARAALENLIAGDLSTEQANGAAAVLMHVGDEHAREMLSRLDTASLGPFLRTGVAEVLSSPGNASVHWPCPEPLVFAQRPDGRFGCRSAVGVPSP